METNEERKKEFILHVLESREIGITQDDETASAEYIIDKYLGEDAYTNLLSDTLEGYRALVDSSEKEKTVKTLSIAKAVLGFYDNCLWIYDASGQDRNSQKRKTLESHIKLAENRISSWIAFK